MYQEFKYSNGYLHYPEWMIKTESQKDGVGYSYFFSEKEAEKKYYEWSKWGGVSWPVHVVPQPPILCTEALQKILEEGKTYTEGLFFCFKTSYFDGTEWVDCVASKAQIKNMRMTADLHHYPVILNQNGFQFHSTLKDETIPMAWHHLWHEVRGWCGDIQKKETAEELVHRLQKMFDLKMKKV